MRVFPPAVRHRQALLSFGEEAEEEEQELEQLGTRKPKSIHDAVADDPRVVAARTRPRPPAYPLLPIRSAPAHSALSAHDTLIA